MEISGCEIFQNWRVGECQLLNSVLVFCQVLVDFGFSNRIMLKTVLD